MLGPHAFVQLSLLTAIQQLELAVPSLQTFFQAQTFCFEVGFALLAGSSILGRAKQLGPHSFVQLSLFPNNQQLELAVPSLQTSFQAQTFCPEFHFRRQLPLTIDARVVRELATQVGKP